MLDGLLESKIVAEINESDNLTQFFIHFPHVLLSSSWLNMLTGALLPQPWKNMYPKTGLCLGISNGTGISILRRTLPGMA
jgi:hypothetical protein